MNGSKSELLAIDSVTASYQGGNAMRLVGNGAMEFVWQGLCSIAGGYVRRAYNSDIASAEGTREVQRCWAN